MFHRTHLTSLMVGLLFALGLGLSGMTHAQKVIGFLDIFGQWDPTLMFVMLGAVGVHFVTYRLIRKRKSPLFVADFQVPTLNQITPQLVLGAALFGIGWGLLGVCPGPAIAILPSGQTQILVFVVAMFLGMWVYQRIEKKIPFT